MIFTIKKLLAYALMLLATLALVWAVGFGLFLYQLNHQKAPSNNIHSNAIVVLTGGDNRVREGIRLLEEGVGDKLFISGVGQGVTVEDILRASNYSSLIPDEALKSRITLGRTAENTKGNAEETNRWTTENNIHSIRLVTAYYHMPRSQLEFHHFMPHIEILQHPVHPASAQLSPKEDLKLSLTEYHKFIAVLLRQAGLWQPS